MKWYVVENFLIQKYNHHRSTLVSYCQILKSVEEILENEVFDVIFPRGIYHERE